MADDDDRKHVDGNGSSSGSSSYQQLRSPGQSQSMRTLSTKHQKLEEEPDADNNDNSDDNNSNNSSSSSGGIGVGVGNKDEAEDEEKTVTKAPPTPLSMTGRATTVPAALLLQKSLQKQADEGMVMEKLISGSIFLKHAYGGRAKPHHKHVWCNVQLNKVMWGSLDKKKVSGSFSVKDILDISVGVASKTFKRSKYMPEAKLCFSILTRDRSLDLECVSQQERDMWVLAFNSLVDMHHKAVKSERRSKKKNKTGKLKSASASNGMDRKQMSSLVLAGEVEVLNDVLKKQTAYANKLESKLAENHIVLDESEVDDAIRKQESADEQALRLKLEKEKAEARMQELARANELVESEAEDMRRQLELLRKAKPRASKVLPELANAEERQVEVERNRALSNQVERLKMEVDAGKLRDQMLKCSTRNGYMNRLSQLPEKVVVPLSVLSSRSPADEEDSESSSDEDDDDVKRAHPNRSRSARQALRDSEKDVVEQKRQMITKLFARCGRVSVNGKIFRVYRDGRGSQHVLKELYDQVRIRTKHTTPPLSAADARHLTMKSVVALTQTETSGDCYAALSWLVGQPDLVVISPEPPYRLVMDSTAARDAALHFDVSVSAIKVSVFHFFKICDAAIMNSSDFQDTSGDVLDHARLTHSTTKFEHVLRLARNIEPLPATIEISFSELKIAPRRERLANGANMSPEEVNEVRQIERDMVKAASEEDKKLSDRQRRRGGFYLINSRWFKAWKQFVAGGSERPGPISNHKLFDVDGITPLAGLKTPADYRALTPGLWKVFVDLYGGGPEIKRSTPTLYN
eukprot:TRINITY_DN66852_c1_g1_i1.p1 TRINITY_DN66852_c1_g1~~TRINITY_DN66852_c1_g1_i1.p1  ORF type:complete len:805 (+),score=436.59 TRINITY_DN66852_c1_g1_i1:26-2440(+)